MVGEARKQGNTGIKNIKDKMEVYFHMLLWKIHHKINYYLLKKAFEKKG